MKNPADIIRRLHRILNQRSDIIGQLEKGPRQIKAAKANSDAAHKALQDHRDLIKKKRMEVDRDQLQLKSREARIFDTTGKMNMAKKNIEYQTLKDQIAADTQANAVLSDEILEKLEEIDRLNGLTSGFEEKIKLVDADLARLEKTFLDRKAVLDVDLERVNGELAATEELLQGELKATYQRLVSTRGVDAIANLEGKSCGGCNTSLPPRHLDRLRMNEPMVCTSCACLIVPPENPNVPR